MRSAVALHGHTHHSREYLTSLSSLVQHNPVLRWWIKKHAPAQSDCAGAFDFSRLWWTPPVTPQAALALESREVEDTLGLAPLVSLTDHDDIDASLGLHVLHGADSVPISFEWTVPRSDTFFHVGVHNLPPASAQELFRAAREYTQRPRSVRLRDIMAAVVEHAGTLLALNHPLWDEKGIGPESHRRALHALIRECRPFLHAIELNGYRPWQENSEAVELARSAGLPVISGGDRHGTEPAAVLNVTSARDFSEFAAEIRSGKSEVVIMPRYLESLRLRVAHAVCEVLRPVVGHSGISHWSDRVFYRLDDGNEVPLSRLWGTGHVPPALACAVGLVSTIDACLAAPRVRSAVTLFTSGGLGSRVPQIDWPGNGRTAVS